MDHAETVLPAQAAPSAPVSDAADVSGVSGAAPGAVRAAEPPSGAVATDATGAGRQRWSALAPYALAAAFFAGYAALSVTRYRQMMTLSWDLGIFEQAVRGYSRLHAPVSDLKGPGFNVLGDHFSPITALIAPFYRVFPGPVTLLVAQALLFALSVVPVTRAAGRVLGPRRGLAVGAAYGLSWGVQRAVDFDFHEIAFAMPLLAFSLEAVLRRKWAAAMWWAVPLVLVKEDMGASVALIGAVVWLRTRGDRRAGGWGRAGAGGTGGVKAGTRAADKVRGRGRGRHAGAYAAGLAGFGVAASAWEIRWLIPAFHGPGYDALNHIDGDGSLTGHVPLDTALRTLLWVLLPAGGLLALRSPLLLVALPTFGWRFVSHYPENWGTAWHYSAVLMPVAFLAFVDAAGKITAAAAATGEAGLGARLRVRFRARARRGLRAYAVGLPAAMLAAALALTTALPMQALSHPGTYRVDARTRAVKKLLDRIPDGATVEANVGPLSRLVHRTTVYWVGGTEGVVPQYLALENASGWVRDPVAYARQLHPRARYAVLVNADGYVVLRRE